MSRTRSASALVIALLAVGSPFHTAAQPATAPGSPRVPVLVVSVVPGFRVRRSRRRWAATSRSTAEAGVPPAITSDAGGACSTRLQAPGNPSDVDPRDRHSGSSRRRSCRGKTTRPRSTCAGSAGCRGRAFCWKRCDQCPPTGAAGIVPRASSTWCMPRRVRRRSATASPSRWSCAFARPATAMPTPASGTTCGWSTAARSMRLPRYALDRSAARDRGGLHAAAVTLSGREGPARVSVVGAVIGEARADGAVDLQVDSWLSASSGRGSSGSGGRKRLVVQPGETIEFQLPESLKAKLPADLQAHDFALRVTTSRLW